MTYQSIIQYRLTIRNVAANVTAFIFTSKSIGTTWEREGGREREGEGERERGRERERERMITETKCKVGKGRRSIIRLINMTNISITYYISITYSTNYVGNQL